MRSLVITPTYNERDNITEALARLFQAAPEGVDVLVVDDGSPDGTADEVERLAHEDERINLLRRTSKQGLGSAYITGFRWAIERGYTAAVEMDADLSHDPADVPRLLAGLADADLVIGSRYVPGGGVENWDSRRKLLSSFANRYVRAALGFSVRDSTAGFRAYRTSALAELELDSIRSEGYSFQVEMTRRVWLRGGTISEVPITFRERAAGASKMSLRIVVEALIRVGGWGLVDLPKRLTRKRREP